VWEMTLATSALVAKDDIMTSRQATTPASGCRRSCTGMYASSATRSAMSSAFEQRKRRSGPVWMIASVWCNSSNVKRCKPRHRAAAEVMRASVCAQEILEGSCKGLAGNLAQGAHHRACCAGAQRWG